MDGSDGVVWFLGDLSDPWVLAIAASVPASWTVARTQCAGSLPDEWMFVADRTPDVIVMHRNRLTMVDAERIQSWRNTTISRQLPLDAGVSLLSPEGGPGPRIVLCASPYLRYEELERSVSLIDDVISEATAADVLPMRLGRLSRPQRARRAGVETLLRIDVVSGDEELREMLVDACLRHGYPARGISDRSGRADLFVNDSSAIERVLTIWDVPVLEPDWAERLGLYRRMSAGVIALAGFADRGTVTTAKSRGAIACLDLPCEIDDLLDLIERYAHGSPPGVRFDQAHQVPPALRVGEGVRPGQRNVVTPAWPESARSSTISRRS